MAEYQCKDNPSNLEFSWNENIGSLHFRIDDSNPSERNTYMPMAHCLNVQDYGAGYTDYDDLDTIRQCIASMFSESICICNSNMRKGIFPKTDNFINAYLMECVPQKAADPFYMFGVDLYCVRSLDAIFKNEGLDISYIESVATEITKDIETFLRKLTKYKDRTRHYFGNVLAELIYARKIGVQWVDEFIATHCGETASFAALWEYIQYMYLDEWTYKTEAEIEDDIKLLGASELSEFVSLLLKLDLKCFRSRAVQIKQFNYDDIQRTEQCTSLDTNKLIAETDYDLVATKDTDNFGYRAFVTVKVQGFQSPTEKHKNLFTQSSDTLKESEVKNAGQMGRIVCIEPGLLWGQFEQLLGLMFQTKQDTTGKRIIFQSGFLISNDTLRVIVLGLDVNTYEMLFPLNSAVETMNKLQRMYARRGKMWCRLYVDSNTHHITEAATVARSCITNFTSAY